MNRCANCNSTLAGPYCAQCGQHAHSSARSMGTLLHDGWHVLTHVDSRLWRTLGALVGKPGHLTREYFRDHRERYLPPVRLYLVISLLFFAIASFGDSQVSTVVQAEPDAPAAADTAEPAAGGCSQLSGGPEWLAQWSRTACERIAADKGASLIAAMRSNVPRMMFLFLPVLAAAMKPLYWRPRRLYVEHLVFCLHTHAAMFIAILAMLFVDSLGRWLPAASGPLDLMQFALSLYMLWYLYRAMRVTYEQSRRRTIAKFAAVSLAYFTCLVLVVMLMLTGILSLQMI
jgi:hypothetical protein